MTDAETPLATLKARAATFSEDRDWDQFHEEEDGPMLQHGLQGFHGVVLEVPRSKALQPRRDFLEERYQLFRDAS